MSIDLLDYQVMAFDTGKFLSFVIRTNGEIVPTMPDDEEFSASQIGAYVAGTPEVVGETHDGFLLFQSKEGTERGSPVNELATSMYGATGGRAGSLVGRIFLAHPGHVAQYWIPSKR